MPILITVKNTIKEGFHLDLDDFLMGLLQLCSELVRILSIFSSHDNCMYSNDKISFRLVLLLIVLQMVTLIDQ